MNRIHTVGAGFAASLLLLFAGSSVCVAAPPSTAVELATNVRMQNVIKDFVKSTGQEVIGLGSWISGKKYSDVLSAAGTSDHDLRLLGKGGSPAELQREWMRARATLTDMVRKEFGKDGDKVLGSINLYPPSQLMKGVEDASEALGRFKKIGNVPNLGFTGPISEAPEKFAEGLYGQGSKVWTQAYEESAGRLFYLKDGKVFVGFTDLTHLSEGIPKYDVPGMCNTASQWADHIVEELHEGRGDKVAKYLERLDRDLAKAKSLAQVDLDPAWRAEVRKLAETLKKNPGKAAELQNEIRAVLARTKGEASLLNQMTKATGPEQKVLAQALKELKSGGKFSKLLREAGEVVTLDRVMTAITVILHVRQTAKFAGEEEYHQAISTALAGAVGLVSFPPGLLMDVTNWVLESAKTSGYDMVASTQEAWDLMAGIYTAIGRTGVDDRSYTLDELVDKLDDEKKLEALVYSRAMRASSREAGAETGKTDQKVGEAIFGRCYPIILAAWRARREELAVEYTTILDELEHTPLFLKYTPSPAGLGSKQKLLVTVDGEFESPNFDAKLTRAKQILTMLYKTGVFADVEWKWHGGKEASGKTRRVYEFDATGVFPVTVEVKVSTGAANERIGQVMAREFSIQSGIDVKIEALEFDYRFLSFNTLLQAPGVINANYPHVAELNKTNAPSTPSIQLLDDDVPIAVKGNSFSASFLDRGEYGPKWPGKVRVEGVFNDDKTVIETLTITYHAERKVPRVEQGLEWKFTAKGIPIMYATEGKKLEYSVEAEKPVERPKDFQLMAEYLKTDNKGDVGDVETWREDKFEPAKADVRLRLYFRKEPRKNPPVPMDVPR